MTWLPSHRFTPVLTVDKLCDRREAPDLAEFPADYPAFEAPRNNHEDSIECYRRHLVEKTEARRIQATFSEIHDEGALAEAQRHADLHTAWANSWFAHANAAKERERRIWIERYQHTWLNARQAMLDEIATSSEARMNEPACSGASSDTAPLHHLSF